MSNVGVKRTRNALTVTRIRSAFAQSICHAQLQSPPRLSPARFRKSPRTSRILNRKFNITGIYPESKCKIETPQSIVWDGAANGNTFHLKSIQEGFLCKCLNQPSYLRPIKHPVISLLADDPLNNKIFEIHPLTATKTKAYEYSS
jgi:hypothetical protein